MDEEALIEHLAKLFPAKAPLVGIGDDCAVIPGNHKEAWLVTTDALVEGVHFLKEQIDAIDLGYKSVAVNVSDIVAMGGRPKYAFLSIALPKSTESSWARLVMEGIKKACDKWDILLLGGDTVGSKRDVFISLTLIGSAAQEKIKYRSKARGGDLICVSGYLGDAGGGLKALQQGTLKTKEVNHLIEAHFQPNPSPAQGMWLGAHEEVHAMMDISDGLECDLRHLLKQSEKGAVIELELIPLSPTLSKVSTKEGWDALQLALTGGEDYCLLFTVAPESFETLQHAFQSQFHTPLFCIGHITDKSRELLYQKSGKVVQMNYPLYNHFQ